MKKPIPSPTPIRDIKGSGNRVPLPESVQDMHNKSLSIGDYLKKYEGSSYSKLPSTLSWHEAAKLIGLIPPNSPYPQPKIRSLSELGNTQAILRWKGRITKSPLSNGNG